MWKNYTSGNITNNTNIRQPRIFLEQNQKKSYLSEKNMVLPQDLMI